MRVAERASHPLPVSGVGVGVEPQQGLLVHDCSDRLAGHGGVNSPPGQVQTSGRFLSSEQRHESASHVT